MCKIEVSQSAYNYLKELAEPFIDTPKSVLDRIISDHQERNGRKGTKTDENTPKKGNLRVQYRIEQLPPLLHTKIEQAKISEKLVVRPKWSGLVEEMIRNAGNLGYNADEIIAALDAQTWRGERTDTGFRYVEEVGISFQGLDANRSCKAALGLSRAFNIPIEIDFFWRENGNAYNPGSTGRIVGP